MGWRIPSAYQTVSICLHWKSSPTKPWNKINSSPAFQRWMENPPPPSKHHHSNGYFFRCWIWRSSNLPSTAPHCNHVTLFQGGWEWTFSKTPKAISQMAQTCSQNGTNPHSFTWLTVCHAVAFSNSSPAFQRWMENPPPPSKHHHSNGYFFRCWIWRSSNLPSTAPHCNHLWPRRAVS